MKKRQLLTIFVLIALVTVVGTILFYGKSFGVTQKIKWHEEVVMGLKSEDYATHYWIEHCDVYTYRNGKGIHIEAIDPEDNGRVLRQSIVVADPPMEDGYRSPVIGEQFFIDGGGASLSPENYYDIFYAHCLQNVKLLPEDVKKSFFGFYGIK